jgi:hypothetical protein
MLILLCGGNCCASDALVQVFLSHAVPSMRVSVSHSDGPLSLCVVNNCHSLSSENVANKFNLV